MTTVHVAVHDASHVVIGHISNDRCENANCRKLYDAGLTWHATARGFAVVLCPNHFRTADDAIAALVNAANEAPGRIAVSVNYHRDDLRAGLHAMFIGEGGTYVATCRHDDDPAQHATLRRQAELGAWA
jgi:hypothetical protein